MASSALASALQHFQRGHLDRAEQECRRALASDPDDPDAMNLLGVVMTRAGSPAGALAILTDAIARHPNLPKLYLNRGEAYRASNELDRAISDYRAALSLDPNYAQAFYNLGIALRAQDKLDDAIDAYREAVRIKPDYVKAHYNLANALRARLDFDDAERAYREALKLDPRSAESWNNLGEMLMERMRVDDADAALSRAIELRPHHASAEFNRAFLRLLRGDYERGWIDHEWRPAMTAIRARNLSQPVWDGSNLAGKTILLHAEQGAGDTIQFIRYATMLKSERNAARVIVEAQPPLVELLRTVPGIDEVLMQGESLPQFDVQVPVLSLPRVFHTTLDTVPATVPYLSAATEHVAPLHDLIAPHRRTLNVGLAWAGNPSQVNDRNRSAKLDALAPLFATPNTRFFSLQKGQSATHSELIDLSPHLNDFADTAAAIENLDVIVSVCTSVAHVAGALAKPTIAMLCFNADWRWLVDRADSPWYPTMKLVRQKKQGDWTDVARRVREQLEQMLTAKAPISPS